MGSSGESERWGGEGGTFGLSKQWSHNHEVQTTLKKHPKGPNPDFIEIRHYIHWHYTNSYLKNSPIRNIFLGK